MRALRRDVLPVLNMRTVGMEFASEMVIRATREQLDVREIPIELHPRVGDSKLSPFRDGWRHLRLILVYNPTFLFLLPGAVMLALGCSSRCSCSLSPDLRARPLHPLAHPRLPAHHPRCAGDRLRAVRPCLRRLLHQRAGPALPDAARAVQARARAPARGGVTVAGFALFGVVVGEWAAGGFGALSEERLAILAATLIVVAAQIFFTSFMLSILGLRRRPDEP